MFMHGLGQSSSRRSTGRSMAKLLADKMYKEIESKRRSRSVIARLMGLDGLPSLWHVHRPRKRDSYERKNVPVYIQPNSLLYDDRSGRRSPLEKQELNDVYEDLEASHFVNRRCSSRWSASSMLTKSEMELIQRYIDGTRLSADETTDEKLQKLKQLDDTLDMLDSKKDLRMKLVQRSDIRVTPSSSLGRHTAGFKQSNSAKNERNARARISDRDATGNQSITFDPKRKDALLLEPYNCHRAHISCRSLKMQLEEKNEKTMPPTRIVVLRPNLGNMPDAGISGSSSHHSHGYVPNFRKTKEYPGVGGAEKLSWRRKDPSYNTGYSKPVSKEAREIAREITKRMRGGCDDTVNANSSRFRGYAGDESSYDAQESYSDSETEMFKISSRNSFRESNKWGRHPSSSSVEFFVNREAKKRLSERWKVTQRYRDLEIVAEGRTLGEMLAIHDGETRSKHYANTSLGRKSARLGSNNGSSMWNGPLGISSNDGWKDEILRTSSRSRSLPPSIGGRSHRRGTYHDLADEKKMMRSDPKHCVRSKVAKQNLSGKEFFSSQGSKARNKKPLPCQFIYNNEIDSSSGANFEIQMEANVKDVSDQQLMFHMTAKDDSSQIPTSDVVIAEHGNTTLSSKSSLLQPKQSSFVDKDKAAVLDQEDFSPQELHKGPPEEGSPSLQHLGSELAFPESSKEADHASPISVLEVPFMEDASSSSESFERVNAELNELRMQLQLVKMESCATEIPTLVDIKEDIAKLSSILSEENYILEEEGWEVSYTLDILIHSGLQQSGFDLFRIMWHSPDSPLDPGLFDTLEKKYSDEITGMKSERMLLFDRINLALLDIFQQHVDLYPWVMPKVAGLHSTWQKEQVTEALEKLINQESGNGHVPERALDREMQWTDAKEELDGIGNEIEILMIDDMINEFLCE